MDHPRLSKISGQYAHIACPIPKLNMNMNINVKMIIPNWLPIQAHTPESVSEIHIIISLN